MNKNITLLIADDHPVFLNGLEALLQKETRISVVAKAGDGLSALEAIRSKKPDIAILDIYMPKMDGVEVLRAVLNEGLNVKVIILSMHKEEHLTKSLHAMGLRGYILKENAMTEILQCIEAVAAGGIFYSPQAAAHLISQDEKAGDPAKKLTPMELRVLALIAEEKSTRQISEMLYLSDNTIRNHRSNICKKLGISGNFALVRYALKMKENKGQHS